MSVRRPVEDSTASQIQSSAPIAPADGHGRPRRRLRSASERQTERHEGEHDDDLAARHPEPVHRERDERGVEPAGADGGQDDPPPAPATGRQQARGRTAPATTPATRRRCRSPGRRAGRRAAGSDRADRPGCRRRRTRRCRRSGRRWRTRSSRRTRRGGRAGTARRRRRPHRQRHPPPVADVGAKQQGDPEHGGDRGVLHGQPRQGDDGERTRRGLAPLRRGRGEQRDGDDDGERGGHLRIDLGAVGGERDADERRADPDRRRRPAPPAARRIATPVVSAAVRPATAASVALAAAHPPRRIGSASTAGSSGSCGDTCRPDAVERHRLRVESISWYGGVPPRRRSRR